jgi:hypothetical protein
MSTFLCEKDLYIVFDQLINLHLGKRYVALAVVVRNIQQLGAILRRQELERDRLERRQKLRKAA